MKITNCKFRKQSLKTKQKTKNMNKIENFNYVCTKLCWFFELQNTKYKIQNTKYNYRFRR